MITIFMDNVILSVVNISSCFLMTRNAYYVDFAFHVIPEIRMSSIASETNKFVLINIINQLNF